MLYINLISLIYHKKNIVKKKVVMFNLKIVL